MYVAMKDIQGNQRGKCNSCECEEYRTPPSDSSSGRLRCEYCNHTPGEHVKIIPLGACSNCGPENCGSYDPEDPNSYSDCQYCGCGAVHHVGAEKLRKKAPSQAVEIEAATGFTPRADALGNPLQTDRNGPCKRQGCPYPRRIDESTGKVFDYCGRTCALKDSASQRSSAMCGRASGSTAVPGGRSGAGDAVVIPMVNSKNPHDVKMFAVVRCQKCKKNPANPGHKWCQTCFTSNPNH